MSNPIVNVINAIASWVDDFARLIANGRSSDALLAETIDSMHASFGQSYEATKDAAGQIQVSLDSLAQAKSTQKVAHANVNRAVRDAQSLSGNDLQIQQAKIVGLQKLATNTDEVVAAMEATIERAKHTQTLVEGRVAVEATNMQLRETTARLNVAMEKMFGTVERVNDSQLRAAGYLDNKQVKDHSSELSRRAAQAQGRAESSGRMVEQIVGNPFANSLSEDEQEILAAAYQAAGKTLPAAEQKQTEKSAS